MLEADDAVAQELELALIHLPLPLGLLQLFLGKADFRQARAAQGDAPGDAVAHRADAVELGGRAVNSEAGANGCRRAHVLELGLDEVRELQILEEQIEKFLLRQDEDEIILAMPVRRAMRAASASALGRFRDRIADDIALIAGKDEIARPVSPQMEGGLVQALGADTDFLAAFDFGDLPALQRLIYRVANILPSAAKKTLAVAEALLLRVQTAVDDVHSLA
jgi:hypothetical protein